MKKKLILVFSVLASCLLLFASCSKSDTSSADGTVNAYFDALEKGEVELAYSYVSPDNLSLLKLQNEDSALATSALKNAAIEIVSTAYFAGTGSEENPQQAIVALGGKIKSFADVSLELNTYFAENLEALSSMKESKQVKQVASAYSKAFSGASTTDLDVALKLSKNDAGKWEILNAEDFENALFSVN